MLSFQRIIQPESSNDDNFLPNFTKGWNPVLGIPSIRVIYVVGMEYLAELLICCSPRAFALQRHYNCLAWILVQECDDLAKQVTKVFLTSERYGEDTVNKD